MNMKFFMLSEEANSLREELDGLMERIKELEERHLEVLRKFLKNEGYDVMLDETHEGKVFLKFSSSLEKGEVVTRTKYLKVIQGAYSSGKPIFKIETFNGANSGFTVHLIY